MTHEPASSPVNVSISPAVTNDAVPLYGTASGSDDKLEDEVGDMDDAAPVAPDAEIAAEIPAPPEEEEMR